MTDAASAGTAIAPEAAKAADAPDVADVAAAKATIAKGSKSFAVAAKLFAPAMRADAVLLYAWCRHCDDVIDGQELGFAAPSPGVAAGLPGSQASTPEARLAALRAETLAALDGTATDPVFRAVGAVMRRHAIPARYALDHLDGFAMDVAGRRYRTLDDLLGYCYGVAGVVGLMMAHIMGVRDPAVLRRATDLGLAFQLTNIARDLVPDAAVGRVYAPEDWLAAAGIPLNALAEPAHRQALATVAARLVAAAEPLYASARLGVAALPFRAAWAIGTASGVYRAIGTAVVRRGPRAWDSRVSTSTMAKLGHVAAGLGLALVG
ncbi:phytoene/squalene synthase family protein [Lichenihabitans sp. Uapishka_5]|uniref:phytoene/squalene synthase family protein n=1 Tax=Lichenihabitans sp. Uapishka_5 TaxID=3037302 RepID=UPI0029E80DA0|nr:phytoene/squalene synthase family protein [Lichenihabitans sp. Uapishka_5]MDX7953775.1 phytoene/squalene synthase family protein [Lichenihabitans sp. Uapishka_5]